MTAWLLLLAASALGSELSAQQQALLLLKILPYDRNLEARSPGVIRVGILSSPGRARAVGQIEAALRQLSSTSALEPWAIEVVTVSHASPDQLRVELLERQLAALYLPPRSPALSGVLQLTRAQDVLTFSPDPDAVRAGVSVGLVVDGGKAGILINLASCRAEGSDFPANFLSLAEVVR